MKDDLREVHGAPTRAAAETAITVFDQKYRAKYPKAVTCLTKDREALLTCFDFLLNTGCAFRGSWAVISRQGGQRFHAIIGNVTPDRRWLWNQGFWLASRDRF